MALSRRAMNVVDSLTLKISAMAKQMKADGKDVIGFGAGEPDFGTPDYIIEGAKQALDMGMTRYTPASGRLDLKKAICQKFKEDNNLDYKPENIVISNGAKHSLYNVFQALLDEGDEVIIPDPYWVSYPEMVKLSLGVPVFVETDEKSGFLAKAKDIETHITKSTKAIVINSPGNPCGGVYTPQELAEIAMVAKKHNVYVISDEIYEKLIYDGLKHMSIASIDEEIKALTIVINGCSKAFAMTGFRIGYLAAPKQIASAISKMQSHETSNPCSVSQQAAMVALTTKNDAVENMRKAFEKRRDMLVDIIDGIDYISCNKPKGAFYIMLNISQIMGKKYKDIEIDSSMTFSQMLLEHEFVAVVPGVAFGDDNCLMRFLKKKSRKVFAALRNLYQICKINKITIALKTVLWYTKKNNYFTGGMHYD